MLVLLPAEADLVLKEGYSKKNLVSVLDSSAGKIIFALLTEVVAFHVGSTAIHIWGLAFKGLS